MARTLEDARKVVMELDPEDRQVLAEEIIASRWSARWVDAWMVEVERREQRLESGEDRELTIEEFFSDEGD